MKTGILDNVQRIVTNGLVLNLDAGNPLSYPGSGSTWTDLSGNGNNGTLTNGPTFDSANGGSIVFDGTDDYVINSSCSNLPQGSSARTVQMWVYFNSNTNNIIQIGLEGANTSGCVYIIEYLQLVDVFLFTDGANGDNNITMSGGELPGTGAWVNFTFLHSYPDWYYYINGSLKKSGTFTVEFDTEGQQYVIGKRLDVIQPLFWGKMATMSIYNRALSASEVLQNFNALKSRFGL
jgi:hypothetical protein